MAEQHIELSPTSFYLPTVNALVTEVTMQHFANGDVASKEVDTRKGIIKVRPWGDDDTLPLDIVSKVNANTILSQGLRFNSNIAYGGGIVPVRREVDANGKVALTPVYDNEPINLFFEDNNIAEYFIEQCIDLSFFGMSCSELVLNSEAKRQIVQLNHLEASFSRWSEANEKTNKIEYHLYSAKFGTSQRPEKNDIAVTPALDRRSPLRDMQQRMGLIPRFDGTTKADKDNRYIVPVTMPTPACVYYPRSSWWSVFESGWYEFAQQIPNFKKSVMKNQMTLKYMVKLSPNYWKNLFASEGITDPKKKDERKALELSNIRDFLTDTKNAGKSPISTQEFIPNVGLVPAIEVVTLQNKSLTDGGEYLSDLQEVYGILAGALGIHPGMFGSVPGGKTNLSGSDVRERFIITQSLYTAFRERLLKPLYIVKAINGWDPDIYFTVPNLELTTLDRGTGSQKVIS